jgi:DNA-binding response OmpR family regulator
MADYTGVRILVVEDEFLVATMIEDDLTEHGFVVVGPYGTVAAALYAAQTENFDLAVLDVNLRGQSIVPVAKAIKARGIPILIFTGYSTLDHYPDLADLPQVTKPGLNGDFMRALDELILRGSPAG